MMGNKSFLEINKSPIILDNKSFSIDMSIISEAIDRVNYKFQHLKTRTTPMAINVFEIIDFRMLSGLVGEVLATDINEHFIELEKNPNIDGYPDLLNASTPEYRQDIEKWRTNNSSDKFIKYPYGGIEIKNTFGTKKQNAELPPGATRVEKINNKLAWKAHHRYTNNLLALFSDYVDETPQIVAVMFANNLSELDWKEKQNPKKDSAMTSFSVTQPSAWEKLKAGLRLCRNDKRYTSFFGL